MLAGWIGDDEAGRTPSVEGIGRPESGNVGESTRPSAKSKSWPILPFWLTWVWWRTWWFPPIIQDDPLYRETDAWALDYTPSKKDDVHSPVLQFAERRFDQMVKATENVDKKADDLIRTASTIGAALVAATKIFAASNAFLISPTVMFLVLATIVASRARTPMFHSQPHSVRTLINVAALEDIESKVQLECVAAASLLCATIGIRVINNWKATQVARATALFCCALILLFVLILPI